MAETKSIRVPVELRDLLLAARDAEPNQRIEFRNPIADYGSIAVPPLVKFVRANPDCAYFVVAVLDRMATQKTKDAEATIEYLATGAFPRKVKAAASEAIELRRRRASKAAAKDPAFPVISKINQTRLQRGEPLLDRTETAQVRENLLHRVESPARYRNHCWHCGAVVDEATNARCLECGWLVCWCVACREPTQPWPSPNGPIGPCAREAVPFRMELSYPVRDYRGNRIDYGLPRIEKTER